MNRLDFSAIMAVIRYYISPDHGMNQGELQGVPKRKDTTLKPTLTLLPNNIILEVLGQRSLWVHPRVTFLCSTL